MWKKVCSHVLDDGFECEIAVESCAYVSVSIKSDLIVWFRSKCRKNRVGFPNAEKIVLVYGSETWIFRNLKLDSTINSVYIPDRRINKTLNTLSGIENSVRIHRRVHVKAVASFVGQIISMSIVQSKFHKLWPGIRV